MKYLLLVLGLLTSVLLNAQTFSGKVVDASSMEPLAFVNVVFNEGYTGVSTDIDGNFSIEKFNDLKSLTFTYVGYNRVTIPIENIQPNGTIKLSRLAVGIDEIVILPGVNPAHRIIDLAIENRKKNNPETASEFYYESYNKLVFTGDLDSNIFYNPDSISTLDSGKQNMYKFFTQQHLFMMESVTERNHLPPDFSKKLSPHLEFLALKIQPLA